MQAYVSHDVNTLLSQLPSRSCDMYSRQKLTVQILTRRVQKQIPLTSPTTEAGMLWISDQGRVFFSMWYLTQLTSFYADGNFVTFRDCYNCVNSVVCRCEVRIRYEAKWKSEKSIDTIKKLFNRGKLWAAVTPEQTEQENLGIEATSVRDSVFR